MLCFFLPAQVLPPPPTVTCTRGTFAPGGDARRGPGAWTEEGGGGGGEAAGLGTSAPF